MGGRSVAQRFVLAQLAVIAALVLLATIALVVDARAHVREEAQSRMLTLATAIADSPQVSDAVHAGAPTTALTAYLTRLTTAAHADFVTVMTPDGIRLSHPNPMRIGERYLGSIDSARAGTAETEIYTGTLGPSARAVVPVFDGDTVIGMVAAGVTLDSLAPPLFARIGAVLALAAGLLLSGTLGAIWLGRSLRRVTHGQGPEQLGQMYTLARTALTASRDGLLLSDADGRILLASTEALRLLDLGDDRTTPLTRTDDPRLPAELRALLRGRRRVRDAVVLTDTRVLTVSQHAESGEGAPEPAAWLDPALGMEAEEITAEESATGGLVTVIRDHTEVDRLTEQLDRAQTLGEALRSQSHEYANRLHAIVTLVEMGREREVVEFATRELEIGQAAADRLVAGVDEPAIAALLLAKSAEATERGITLSVVTYGTPPADLLPARDAVTILGNLIDNAFDAAATHTLQPEYWVEVELVVDTAVSISVWDSGPGVGGVALADLCERGFSTKHRGALDRGLGLALVDRTVRRLGGTLLLDDTDVTGAGARFTVLIGER